MKKITLLVSLALLFVVNSCRKPEISAPSAPTSIPDPSELDAFIHSALDKTGQFEWSTASDELIWTALANADHVLSVGYKPAAENNIEERLHLINIQTPDWQAARQAVMNIVLENERALDPSLTEARLLAFKENGVLPVFDVRINNPETIKALRASNLVRYAEPIGYEPYMTENADRSDSGCGSNTPQTGLVSGVDYTTIAPACKASWNHPFHKISQAWNNSTGSGITIMVIDSGCSEDQNNLEEGFNQGQSSGRTIEKEVTLPQETDFWGNPVGDPETPNDLCGHGTSMLGACGAPRGTDGAACGIAYNTNLISVRAAADVYLDESREVVGVTNAFTMAATNSSVRIISMSMGRLTSSSQMRDAIILAYNNGKMIFAAAGTSFSWTAWFAGVIWPASMTQCIAVTGIQDNLTTKCSACHVGSKVDFVLVMEKASNGRHPLSLAMDGDVPSTVGGSSVSTSSTAGIAALVMGKYPSWTRQQVFDRLKTSSNYYPSRNNNFGWGRINAQTATQ